MRLPSLWTVIGLLVVAGIIYAILEPVALFGYDGPALGESLESAVEDSHGESKCEQAQGDTWDCFTGLDLNRAYRLTVDDEGCWTGMPVPSQSTPRPTPDEVDGCVDILDIIGIADLIDI